MPPLRSRYSFVRPRAAHCPGWCADLGSPSWLSPPFVSAWPLLGPCPTPQYPCAIRAHLALCSGSPRPPRVPFGGLSQRSRGGTQDAAAKTPYCTSLLQVALTREGLCRRFAVVTALSVLVRPAAQGGARTSVPHPGSAHLSCLLGSFSGPAPHLSTPVPFAPT